MPTNRLARPLSPDDTALLTAMGILARSYGLVMTPREKVKMPGQTFLVSIRQWEDALGFAAEVWRRAGLPGQPDIRLDGERAKVVFNIPPDSYSEAVFAVWRMLEPAYIAFELVASAAPNVREWWDKDKPAHLGLDEPFFQVKAFSGIKVTFFSGYSVSLQTHAAFVTWPMDVFQVHKDTAGKGWLRVIKLTDKAPGRWITAESVQPSEA